MSDLLNVPRRFLSARMRSSQTTGPILLAVTIGMGAGLTAVALRYAVDLMHLLFQEHLGGALRPALGFAWTIPVIALGGLLVGLISRYLAPEAKGHGVPEVMLAVARHGGRIRARVAFVKIFAATITIGSGGSAGRAGPIVHISSSLGSMLAQWLRLSDRMVTLAVACGAAGGIAATFNAPMAGVMFSLEIILRRFTAHYFGLVVISSASATMMMRWLPGTGDYPQFPLLENYSLISAWDLFFFIVLGALAALAAHAFVMCLHAVEHVTKRTPISDIFKPALGGALMGVLAIWMPQIMGSGYAAIEGVLNNNIAGWTMVFLCLGKMIGTALTVGSGGSGGVFVPSLFVGAMLGGAYGNLLNTWCPEIVSSPGAYSLVGMSVVFAAAAHAPITGILVLIEMTDNYYIIVPLMSATVMGTFISQRISKDSMYTVKLAQRGIRIGDAPEVNLMDAVTVKQAMDRNVDGVPLDMPVPRLIEKMAVAHESGFLVVDDKDHLLGVVTARDVENAIREKVPEELQVKDIYTTNVVICRPEQTLAAAIAQFGVHSYGRLPVIDPFHPTRVIGVLKRHNIISACVDAHLRSDEMMVQAEQHQEMRRHTAMAIESLTVGANTPLAGVYVREAGFPEESILGAIRRDNRTMVPRGSTIIMPGDELIILTTQSHVEALGQWLRDRA